MLSYSDLPEDIAFNILSRMPAKSIGLCRCVSHSWRALLSSPDFIKTHLEVRRNLREDSILLICNQSYLSYASMSDASHLFDEITVSAKRLNFAGHADSWLRIYGSCDGLLLLKGKGNSGMFVLNPITREIRKVPVSPCAVVSRSSFTVHGFGYDSATDDYKIVSIYYDHENVDDPDHTTEMFVDVYSLRSDTWKKGGSLLNHHPVPLFTSGVYVNGHIHWLIRRRADGNDIVLSFDVLQEKFREVATPPGSVFGDIAFLALVGGHLCTSGLRNTDVWMMKEYGMEHSWTKFMVNYPQLNRVIPLCMLGQDELVLRDFKKLYAYNLKEQKLKDIVVDGTLQKFFDATSFVESLVSPY